MPPRGRAACRALRLASRAGTHRRRRRRPRARRSSGSARGLATALDYLFDQASVGRWASRRARRAAADVLGPAGDGPGPAPAGRPPWPRCSTSSATGSRRTSSTPSIRGRSATSPRRRSSMSIVGELLAQFAQQGVDVWHAGPIGAFVEEEVVRWLCDLVGYGPGSFGLLTSGGVMANFIAMALARDVHLARSWAPIGRPAGAASRASASTRPTRPTSRSPARSTSSASRPRRSSSCRPTTDSGSAARRSPRRSPRPGGGPHARSRSRPWRARRTRARST